MQNDLYDQINLSPRPRRCKQRSVALFGNEKEDGSLPEQLFFANDTRPHRRTMSLRLPHDNVNEHSHTTFFSNEISATTEEEAIPLPPRPERWKYQGRCQSESVITDIARHKRESDLMSPRAADLFDPHKKQDNLENHESHVHHLHELDANKEDDPFKEDDPANKENNPANKESKVTEDVNEKNESRDTSNEPTLARDGENGKALENLMEEEKTKEPKTLDPIKLASRHVPDVQERSTLSLTKQSSSSELYLKDKQEHDPRSDNPYISSSGQVEMPRCCLGGFLFHWFERKKAAKVATAGTFKN